LRLHQDSGAAAIGGAEAAVEAESDGCPNTSSA
jgi:hypothetical protein